MPHTYVDTPEFLAGSFAAREAIRAIPKIVGDNCGNSVTEYFEQRDVCIASFLAAAGVLPDYTAGFLAAIVELIVLEEQNGATYDLERWSGEMQMTIEERRKDREEFAAYTAEESISQPKSNVVQLPLR